MRRGWTPDRLAGRPTADATPEAELPGAADPGTPRRRLAVLCCMDCRLDPAALLGLRPGDAHILRNAGARVTPDVVRSLAASQHLLGTRQIVVMGHTDCRGLERAGDPFTSVRAAIHAIFTSESIPHRAAVRGMVVDLDEGLLLPVAGGPSRAVA
ncbi:MAG TPA: carbonic anhydrase [Miltoncostaeaceae bacterium]|nr:carbonic anhydrase [Miltoncostaeaceae bacterium]